MPVQLWKQTCTCVNIKLLSTNNTTPTTTTAAAAELDYLVGLRKNLSCFDFRQSKNTRFSFRHRVYQTTIQMVLRALARW
jgi:hypothetical protein